MRRKNQSERERLRAAGLISQSSRGLGLQDRLKFPGMTWRNTPTGEVLLWIHPGCNSSCRVVKISFGQIGMEVGNH